MALILAPEPPLEAWFTALDDQLRRAASYFVNKPIVINLAAARDDGARLEDVVSALEARGLYIIAVEGLEPAELSGTRWAGLPDLRQKAQDREDLGGKPLEIPDDKLPTPAVPAQRVPVVSLPPPHGDYIKAAAFQRRDDVFKPGPVVTRGGQIDDDRLVWRRGAADGEHEPGIERRFRRGDQGHEAAPADAQCWQRGGHRQGGHTLWPSAARGGVLFKKDQLANKHFLKTLGHFITIR